MMRTDFENLEDGDRILLYPNESNLLHNKPMVTTYSNGYYYCDSSDPMKGPDYYFRDVALYNSGFAILRKT